MAADKEPISPELRRLLDLEAARSDPSVALQEQVRRDLTEHLQHRPGLRRVPSTRGWILAGAAVTSAALLAGIAWKLYQPRRPAPAASAAAPPQSEIPAQPADEAPPAKLEPERAPAAPPNPTPENRATRPSRAVAARPRADLDTSLARERELIEQAREALRRGAPAAALALLRQHAREFPQGVLLEERLGLQIEALAASGQTGLARERARAFLKHYPESPLRGAVDAALGQGPARNEP